MFHSEVFYAFLITAAALTVGATILSRLRVPIIVSFVLTGIFIGPSGFNLITSLPAARMISELGIVFLMFTLGLEMSIKHLKRMLRPLLTLGLVQVASTIALSFALFYFIFHFSPSKSFIFGSCLSLSSTAVILKLLHEKRETETPHGRVSIAVLLFQDLAALPLMGALPVMASESATTHGLQTFWVTIFYISAFLIGCLLLGLYFIPRLFKEVMKTNSREIFFFSIISLTFIIGLFAEKVGLSMSLGAFIAGVLISESPYSKQALAELIPFRDIFLGFFFASVGMMLDLKFVATHIHHLLWLIPLLFILKFSIVYFIVRWNSHSHGISFASALALTQVGEFSFILGASALSYKLMSELEFQYFLTLAVSSLLFTPNMFSFAISSSAHNGWHELGESLSRVFSKKTKRRRRPIKVKINHPVVTPRKAIVIGLGHAGIRLLEELKSNGIPCLGIDFNMNHVRAVQAMGIDALYGDGTRPEVLESAGIHNAYLVIITVSGKQLTSQILAVVQFIDSRVRVIVRLHYVLDLIDFSELDINDVIVSEAVASNAIIEKTLQHYGLSGANLPIA